MEAVKINFYISLTYATFYITTNENSIITEAAPICKWTEGKDLDEVINFWKRKKVFLELKRL